MARRELLPDSTAQRSSPGLAKAPRDRHPSAPPADDPAPAPAAQRERSTSKGRSAPTGPGMIRKTYYIDEQIAQKLDEAIQEARSRADGRVSRAEAMAEIIRAGIEQSDLVASRLSRHVPDYS